MEKQTTIVREPDKIYVFVENKTKLFHEVKFFPDFVLHRPLWADPDIPVYLKDMDLFREEFTEYSGNYKDLLN